MIRKATVNDSQAILGILQSFVLDITQLGNPQYESKVQKQGIFVDNGDFTLEEINRRVVESIINNVWEENGKIVGIVDVNREVYFPENADNIIWFDEKRKENYYRSDKAVELHLIAVSSNYHGKGIATKLFVNALVKLKELGYTDLYSILMFGPVTDCPSIIWHAKNGFSRACVTMPIDLFGIKNYQSLLMHRRIN